MRAALMVVCLTLGLAGCGGDEARPVPAGGKVTVGGKPVEGAMVTFLGKGSARSASALTDANGSFKLTTISTNDGVPPGEYVITIAKQESAAGAGGVDISTGNYGAAYGQQMAAAASNTMDKLMKNKLPAKYANPTESGLLRTVVKGEENNFNFEL